MKSLQVGLTGGGWAEADGSDEGIPGRVYVRLTEVEGRPRITEMYIDGRGEPIQQGSVRHFPLGELEDALSGGTTGEVIRASWEFPGVDLSRLAEHVGEPYGPSRGGPGYKGRRCEHCEAPLRGDERRRESRERAGLRTDEAITDWVELSWLAQSTADHPPETRIPQTQGRRAVAHNAAVQPPEVFELSGRPDSLTDGFLADVARAFRSAVARHMPPAVELARQAGEGTSLRTAQGWVYKARKRGLLEPPKHKGRIA